MEVAEVALYPPPYLLARWVNVELVRWKTQQETGKYFFLFEIRCQFKVFLEKKKS